MSELKMKLPLVEIGGGLFDANDNQVATLVLSDFNRNHDKAHAKHIAHCVNLHEELVRALDNAIGLCNVPEHAQDDEWEGSLEDIKHTLTKAKAPL